MEQLIIDRKKWLRGEDGSYLLRRTDKKMCCLGFDLRRRGFKARDIVGLVGPSDVTRSPLKGLINDDGTNTNICGRLMTANDNLNTTKVKRERVIRNLFEQIGIRVKFIN